MQKHGRLEESHDEQVPVRVPVSPLNFGCSTVGACELITPYSSNPSVQKLGSGADMTSDDRAFGARSELVNGGARRELAEAPPRNTGVFYVCMWLSLETRATPRT